MGISKLFILVYHLQVDLCYLLQAIQRQHGKHNNPWNSDLFVPEPNSNSLKLRIPKRWKCLKRLYVTLTIFSIFFSVHNVFVKNLVFTDVQKALVEEPKERILKKTNTCLNFTFLIFLVLHIEKYQYNI